MIINSTVITNRVRAMADDGGLDVQLCEEKVAATSGTVIYIERPKYGWSKDQLTIWESDAYHEIGHCAPANKDIFDIIHEKKIHMKSRLGLCLNVLDDLRQEWEQYGRYAGRDRVMGEGNYLVMRNHIKDGTLDNPEGDEGIEFMSTCFGYMTFVSEWYPAMSGMTARVSDACSPKVQETIIKLIDHDDEINPLGCDGKGVYKRALRLLELLGFDAEQEEKDAKDKTKAAEQLSKAAEEFKKEMLKHVHTDRDVDEHAAAGVAVGYSDPAERTKDIDDKLPPAEITPDYEDYRQSDWSKIKVVDYSLHPSNEVPHHETVRLVAKGMFLGTHVRKLLQTMSQRRNEHGLKRGKISNKSLYRATMTKSGSYQQKIFKKKASVLSLDVAVQLVVDGSGSMAGASKYEAASASATIMSSVLTSLRIKHEVIVFTEVASGAEGVLKHGIIKSFAKGATTEQVMRNFAAFRKIGLDNNLDGESIIWSAMRLAKQDVARKLMIVFSDGQPAAYRRGAAKITKDAIKEIEGRRDMEIYGIGILSEAVSRYYTDYRVITDTGELEGALLSVIKSKIIKK